MKRHAPRISPTAHYTGHVWVRNGLADPGMDTWLGRAMFLLSQPIMAMIRPCIGGMTIERYLLDRHQMIDRLLMESIEREGTTQVLEIASGLSPRGYRFARTYENIRYVEAELPHMAARKRKVLARIGLESENHRVVDLDLLAEGGALSLESVVGRELETEKETVIIAEGLLTYFDGQTLGTLWTRLGKILKTFPRGLFLANAELAREAGSWILIRGFVVSLGSAVGSPVALFFKDEGDARTELAGAGFDHVELYTPGQLLSHAPGPVMVRTLAAWVDDSL